MPLYPPQTDPFLSVDEVGGPDIASSVSELEQELLSRVARKAKALSLGGDGTQKAALYLSEHELYLSV